MNNEISLGKYPPGTCVDDEWLRLHEPIQFAHVQEVIGVDSEYFPPKYHLKSILRSELPKQKRRISNKEA